MKTLLVACAITKKALAVAVTHGKTHDLKVFSGIWTQDSLRCASIG